MYNFSTELTKNKNSCTCTVPTPLVIKSVGSDPIIREVSGARCVVDLLSVDELKRYKNIGSSSNLLEASVENVVVRDKVKEILGYEGYTIDLDNSPAGSITTISFAIFLLSRMHLTNAEVYYRQQEETVTLIEKMTAIISYYLNLSFTEVSKYPINEIYRLYSIVAQSFPSQVSDPFYVEEEEV